MNIKNKKGISPVIATVLLIAMVIVIGLIVFLWVQEIGGETITKFGENVETVCGDLEFSGDYFNEKLSISNTGTVPIFSFKIKIEKSGEYETISVGDIGGWDDDGLSQGEIFNKDYTFDANVEKIILIPVLMGSSKKGEKTFVCDERNGQEIYIY